MSYGGECDGEKIVFVGFLGICREECIEFLKTTLKSQSRTIFRFQNTKSNTSLGFLIFYLVYYLLFFPIIVCDTSGITFPWGQSRSI